MEWTGWILGQVWLLIRRYIVRIFRVNTVFACHHWVGMNPRYVQCECRIVSVATTTTTEPTTTTTEPTTTTTGMYDCHHVAFSFHSNFTKTPLEFNPLIKKRAAGLGGSDGCLFDCWSGGYGFDLRQEIMKYFLRSFSPFRWFKKGSCQFLTKEYAH